MTSTFIPRTAKTVVLVESAEKQVPAYHDARIVDRPIPPLKDNEVLVRIRAAAFNHRELWIRRGQYPRSTVGVPLGADGAAESIGTVIASSRPQDDLMNKRVFLTPSRGWEENPERPEAKFSIVGGIKDIPIGTFTEYVVVDRDEILETPEHLSDEQAAAWPLAGVTAWRAVTYKAKLQRGQNVLITGIGGGVAIFALQLAVAIGANVYVTSGSQEKINKAVELGAKAGFNYKTDTWAQDLATKLQKENASLDAVIDSAGGDIVSKTCNLLKHGGIVVCYGMTANPKVTLTIREVLKNIELKGSTMGSRLQLVEATEFIIEHRIVPIISGILDGLENFEKGFELMRQGSQFGKIVIRIRQGHRGRL